jgi:hypothetical protein
MHQNRVTHARSDGCVFYSIYFCMFNMGRPIKNKRLILKIARNGMIYPQKSIWISIRQMHMIIAKQIPIPTLLKGVNKDASTLLHLVLSSWGLHKYKFCPCWAAHNSYNLLISSKIIEFYSPIVFHSKLHFPLFITLF